MPTSTMGALGLASRTPGSHCSSATRSESTPPSIDQNENENRQRSVHRASSVFMMRVYVPGRGRCVPKWER
jgi:hypothetical protein